MRCTQWTVCTLKTVVLQNNSNISVHLLFFSPRSSISFLQSTHYALKRARERNRRTHKHTKSYKHDPPVSPQRMHRARPTHPPFSPYFPAPNGVSPSCSLRPSSAQRLQKTAAVAKGIRTWNAPDYTTAPTTCDPAIATAGALHKVPPSGRKTLKFTLFWRAAFNSFFFFLARTPAFRHLRRFKKSGYVFFSWRKSNRYGKLLITATVCIGT